MPRYERSWIATASASLRMRSSKTVLPTPLSPTIKMLLVGRPSRTLSIATRTVSRSSSRPANTGGGVPAPLARKDSERIPLEAVYRVYLTRITIAL